MGSGLPIKVGMIGAIIVPFLGHDKLLLESHFIGLTSTRQVL